jgi:hypothetical protein
MTGHPILRTVAVAASAALLLSAIAGPVSAAKPRCMGKVATIVGTKKADVIKGTKKADVIVAKGGNDTVRGQGGNDTICGGPGKDTLRGDVGHDKIRGEGGNDTILGGPGSDKLFGNAGNDKLWGNPANDRLFGGTGRDKLLGQGGNDALDGGPAIDVCRQGVGSGRRVRCELPVPPPPPEPPTLVIAYSDVNNNQAYDAGDVMIAKIVDTNGDTVISPGDTIKMGQYPTSPAVVTPAGVRGAFEDWKVKTHTVAVVNNLGLNDVDVDTTTLGTHVWYRHAGTTNDSYFENGVAASNLSDDYTAGGTDFVAPDPASPSKPTSSLDLSGAGLGDDPFIDVIIY